MIRLGLCCKFIEEPIKFRTTTVAYLKRCSDPFDFLNALVGDNIKALDLAVDYCHQNGIGSFRIVSDFMPAATHPDFLYSIKDLPDGKKYTKALKAIGKKAQDYNLRFSFHPDQFVVLSTPKEEVLQKSIQDIESHTELALLVGADTINIHGGGAYGDKESALNRFKENFKQLSKEAQKRLTVENDDKVYTPEDLLPICSALNIPLVYDVHHHRCLKDSLSIEEATKKALATWDREPLFHISSPLEGWKGPKPFRHHDYIDIEDFPKNWLKIKNFTLEVEAKAKEKAVTQLLRQLENFC